MKPKVLVLDIDGTILPFGEESIDIALQEALIAFQAAGNILALSSGRVVQGMLPFYRALKMDCYGGYLIANNGGVMLQGSPLQQRYAKHVPKAMLKPLYEFATQHDLHMMLMLADRVIYTKMDHAVAIEQASIPIVFEQAQDPSVWFDQPILRVNLTSDHQDLRWMQKRLSEQFGEQLHAVCSQHIFLDVMEPTCDKAFGIEALCQELVCSAEAIVAVGDGDNDMLMLEAAGIGIAMGNAADHVKACADAVAPSVQELGVCWVLDTYFSS
ncbi:MAG: HAD family hydrolase [Erysipelotrichaceae bacterium]